MLLVLLFGSIRWKDLDTMLISIACALHFQQVVKALQAVDALEASRKHLHVTRACLGCRVLRTAVLQEAGLLSPDQ